MKTLTFHLPIEHRLDLTTARVPSSPVIESLLNELGDFCFFLSDRKFDAGFKTVKVAQDWSTRAAALGITLAD